MREQTGAHRMSIPHRLADLQTAALRNTVQGGDNLRILLLLHHCQRLITQLYFEGDPLIPLCPIVATIPDADAIQQLIALLDMNASVPLDCIAYKFDIVLRGRRSTLFENRLEGN